MSQDQFVIWCNDDFRPDQQPQLERLLAGIGRHQLRRFERNDDGQHGAARVALAESDIAFGYPDPGAVVECQKVRWVQLNSAGYTSFDRLEIKQALIERQTILTNSSAVYSEPCAQHLLAMILSLARQLPAALDSQRGSQSWPMLELRAASRLLEGQTVVILGYGAIARRLIELLSPFKLNLITVRRHIAGDEEVAVVHTSRVDACLPLADHLVNILPASDETKNFLNGDRLRSLKQGAIVYNIGRGTTVDQSALAEVLESNHIAAAYLDVADPEPLPPDHPLWTTRNCFITPHTGGGHSNEKERQVHHFLDNLRRFERGDPLHNRVW
jgi:phosphoglycerate dehydrogenase-like enzyme